MIAKLAYLTSPGPNRYVLNIQPWGSELLSQIEISRAHLANIIITDGSLSLREEYPNRVPVDLTESAENEREHRR